MKDYVLTFSCGNVGRHLNFVLQSRIDSFIPMKSNNFFGRRQKRLLCNLPISCSCCITESRPWALFSHTKFAAIYHHQKRLRFRTQPLYFQKKKNLACPQGLHAKNLDFSLEITSQNSVATRPHTKKQKHKTRIVRSRY